MKDQSWWIPGEQTVDPITQRRSSGGIIVDGVHVADTIQCVHCGMHWIPVKGSKKVRGYCSKCKGSHCGGIKCWECNPFKERLGI